MPTTTNPQPFKTHNGEIPAEGRLTVPFTVDFTTTQSYTVDLTAIQQMQNRISMVQTAFFDNSANAQQLLITSQNTQQVLKVPPQSQAYLPMIITNQVTMTVSTTGGVLVPMQFLNFAIAPAVWSVNGFPALTGGTIPVSDAIVESAVQGGVMQINVAGNKTYTDNSGTVTTGGIAQTALSAQPARVAYRFSNLSAGDLWINDVGTAAGPATTGSIKIPSGGLYETQPGLVSSGAISVYGATTGQAFSLLVC